LFRSRFLHLAIAQGFVEVVLALIRMAPHPKLLDTPNDSAQTPIHLAASIGQWRMVRWLIVAGGETVAQEHPGRLALAHSSPKRRRLLL
jgi:NF-kappa-B inhibitor alpha